MPTRAHEHVLALPSPANNLWPLDPPQGQLRHYVGYTAAQAFAEDTPRDVEVGACSQLCGKTEGLALGMKMSYTNFALASMGVMSGLPEAGTS
jgi:hypothetical protein